MSLVLKDRVRETTTVTGTNDAVLLGAAVGFQSFSVVGNGNTCYYTIADQSGGNWEVGIGTYTAAGSTLSRDTVLASSNGGGKAIFTSGTKDVFLTYPSEKAAYLDANNNLNIYSDGELRLNDSTGGEYVALKSPSSLAASYTLTMPVDDGTNGQALITDGSGNLSWSTAASGDVYGPASATSTAVALFDGTTGKLIKNSGVTIDGSNNVSGVAQLNATTVDLTNLEVTNIKAKDGTASITLADSTGVATFSGNVTLSSGTANGVAYLNGSKVLTTGSALTFDGTNFGVGGAALAPLDVYTSQGRFLFRNGANTGGTSDGVGITAVTTDASAVANMNYRALNHAFIISGSEQMRLTSTGLGIGTSSPSEKLDVNGAIAIGGKKFLSKISSASYWWNNTTATYWVDSTGNTVQMALDSAGNLGLGVTPSAWRTDAGTKALQIGNSTFFTQSSGGNYTQVGCNVYQPSNGQNTYIVSDYATKYQQYAGTHIWQIAPSGTAGNAISFTQAMTLDASGNLGIGTSSPGNKLDVVGNIGIKSAGALKLYNAANNATSELYSDATGLTQFSHTGVIRWLNDTATTERMRIDSSGNVGIGTSSPIAGCKLTVASSSEAVIAIQDTDQANTYLTLGHNGGLSQYVSRNGSSFGQHIWYGYDGSSFPERMRIDSGGNLLVGTTSNLYSSRLNVWADGDNVAAEFYRQGTTSGSAIVVFNSNAGGTQTLKSYIDVAAGSLTVLSDENLKENIEPIIDAANKVATLRAVTGNYIGDETRLPFLIAQDVQKVLPEAVSKNDMNNSLGLSYTSVVPLLVAAIKELKAELDATKAEVAALKGL